MMERGEDKVIDSTACNSSATTMDGQMEEPNQDEDVDLSILEELEALCWSVSFQSFAA